jgi:hypothetical protein
MCERLNRRSKRSLWHDCRFLRQYLVLKADDREAWKVFLIHLKAGALAVYSKDPEGLHEIGKHGSA